MRKLKRNQQRGGATAAGWHMMRLAVAVALRQLRLLAHCRRPLSNEAAAIAAAAKSDRCTAVLTGLQLRSDVGLHHHWTGIRDTSTSLGGRQSFNGREGITRPRLSGGASGHFSHEITDSRCLAFAEIIADGGMRVHSDRLRV
jgi:hypothetical protein